MESRKRSRTQTKKNHTGLWLLWSVVLISFGGYFAYQNNQLQTQNVQKQADVKKLKNEITELKSSVKQLQVEKEKSDAERQSRMSFNQALEDKIKQNRFIGSVLVVKNGQVTLEKGYGYANVDKKLENQPTNMFQLASEQKMLTGILVMKLVQDGKLSLTDTLDKFYPGVPNGANITIKDLLSMTSKLKTNLSIKNELTEEQLLKELIPSLELNNTVGWQYSPVNYNVLAGIIRKVTGQNYQTYFQNELINPLQLKQTEFYQKSLSNPLRAQSYVFQKDKEYGDPVQENSVAFSRELGTGNVYSTVGDLYKLMSQLINGQIISKDNLNILWTPTKESTKGYTAGVYSRDNYIFSHGVEGGYESALLMDKTGENGVILLSNQYNKNNSILSLGQKIMQSMVTYNIKLT